MAAISLGWNVLLSAKAMVPTVQQPSDAVGETTGRNKLNSQEDAEQHTDNGMEASPDANKAAVITH
jgi:hypothetical protein